MEYRIIDSNEYVTSEWSGGRTVQFAVYPQWADVKSQNFLWRISSATVETEESDFTVFAGYDRFITTLSGEMVLSYDNKKTVKLVPMQLEAFDGNIHTRSFGKVRDYNLIVSKDCISKMEHFKLTGARKIFSSIETKSVSHCTYGVYCCGDYAVVSLDDSTVMLKNGQQLIVEASVRERVMIGVMGEGDALCFQVCYDEKNSESDNTAETDTDESKKSRITFEDYKLAMKVCFADFRGGRYISRFRKTHWYDDELFHSLQKLNKLCFVLLVDVLTFVAAAMCGYFLLPQGPGIGLVVIWFAVLIFGVNPLIYGLWLPRPLSSHIILRSEMSEEDKAIEKKQLAENPRLEKLLYQYRSAEALDKEVRDKERRR